MLTKIVLLSLLTATPTTRVPGHSSFTVRPRVEVWTNHGDAVYNRGQGVRVYFRADQDAFVTLFRVDTDGRVRVLFPRDPWEDNFVRGGRDFEVLGSDSRNTAFYIDDYPGVGYLFAVAAADPFDYSAIESGNHWDYRTIADGRVRGDPYVALTELAERIVPQDYVDWDYDIVPYHVQQRYEYPRFLCYDCHAYAAYPYWDPYWASCVRFRIVYYDDRYYYPYRYYGTRVVFVRPYRPQPRYVFKDRDGSGRDRFVTKETGARPVNDETRRVAPRNTDGTTSFIPAPRTRPQSVGSPVNTGGRSGDEVRGNAVRRSVSGRTDARDDRGDDNNRSTVGGNQPDRVRTAPREDGQPRGTRVVPDQTRTNPAPSAREKENRGLQPRESSRGESSRGESSRSEPRGASTPNWGSSRGESSRSEPRATPQRESSRGSSSRSEPKAERPRSESKPQPRASEPKSSSRGQEPELRRRKPD